MTERTEAIECADAHCGACAPAVAVPEPAPNRIGAKAGATVFRIQTMDCAVEESEIRRALEPVVGINGLNFQLVARTLAITASENVIAQALTAIRRVGFDPQPLPSANGSAPGQGHDHGHGDDHDHGSANEGLRPLLIALALALAAEGVAFLAAKGTVATVVEMALALGAIWFAGFDTYKKGLIALRFGRLNINALMTAAVTGAFVIGQWSEARW